MRIAIVNGICVKHDAISDAIVAERRYLVEKFGPENVRFFGYKLDALGWNHRIVQSSPQILRDGFFRSADLIIYHFGIYYELFNTIIVGNGRAKRIACFHNVTPKELVSPESHDIIVRSLQQQQNLFFADHIYCDSPFNRDCLVKMGLPLHKLSVVELPVGRPVGYERKASSTSELRLLFIGRIVASKGLIDLLEALELSMLAGAKNFSLKIIGNISFSDSKYLALVRSLLDRNAQLADRVIVLGEVDDPAKWLALSEADVFVLPTYHEGYCVPILEALSAGCYVVSYNNTNVPNVVGPCGKLVGTGDISLLSQVISGLCVTKSKVNCTTIERDIFFQSIGHDNAANFYAGCKSWTDQFSGKEHRRKFLQIVDTVRS